MHHRYSLSNVHACAYNISERMRETDVIIDRLIN